MAQQMTPTKTSIETTDDGTKRQPQIYAKNSFNRYGDDLFGLILAYLSFEDRFRCECVSKQFQRTVFGSVVDITFSNRFIHRLLNDETIDTELLATIAIKCSNIEIIDCRGITSRYEKHIPEVLNTFRDNCRHLRDIYCNLWRNCEQTMSSLGPLVTRIGGINCYTDSQAITHCHRLSHLRLKPLNEVFAANSGTRIVRLDLHYDDNQHLSPLVAANQCLQSLAVNLCWFRAAESLTEWCGQVSRFPQLRQLRLGLLLLMPDGPNSSVVNRSLRTIGLNCKQLKRLALSLSTNGVNLSLPISLDWLRVYSRLKRLDLEIDEAIDDQLLDPLRHCKRLTHLELYIIEMTANVLKELHINCPRLQYLFVYDFNSIIDTECLSHISRLPALQTLVIEDMISDGLNDNDFSDQLHKSPKLKDIEIRAKNGSKFYSK